MFRVYLFVWESAGPLSQNMPADSHRILVQVIAPHVGYIDPVPPPHPPGLSALHMKAADQQAAVNFGPHHWFSGVRQKQTQGACSSLLPVL